MPRVASLRLGWRISLQNLCFVITFFNIGHGSMLPMVAWSMMRYGINPSLNSIGTRRTWL
jgi:ABC-type spermidine/putrescine transport system permease subunit II